MTDFPDELVFEISEEALENVEGSYNGEQPPANMLMDGVLGNIYLTRDHENAPMFKVLYKARGGKYDGFPAWVNVSIKDSAAFAWGHLIEEVLHVSVDDLKRRTIVDRENPRPIGLKVLSIGDRVIDGEQPIHFSVGYEEYKNDDGEVLSIQTRVRMAFAE